MKHIHLITILLFTAFTTIAQTNNRYIEATGQTTYQRDIKHYEATIKISNVHAYGKEAQLTLEERRAIFLKEVENLGLNKNQARIADVDENDRSKTAENEINYIVETTKEDEIEKILLLGKLDSWCYKIRENVVYKPFANKSKVIKEALKDAKNNAELIADVIGKKIDEILVISDYNYEDKPYSTYYTKEERTYRVVARFAIK